MLSTFGSYEWHARNWLGCSIFASSGRSKFCRLCETRQQQPFSLSWRLTGGICCKGCATSRWEQTDYCIFCFGRPSIKRSGTILQEFERFGSVFSSGVFRTQILKGWHGVLCWHSSARHVNLGTVPFCFTVLPDTDGCIFSITTPGGDLHVSIYSVSWRQQNRWLMSLQQCHASCRLNH